MSRQLQTTSASTFLYGLWLTEIAAIVVVPVGRAVQYPFRRDFALGIAVNSISRSRPERSLVAPISLLFAMLVLVVKFK